MTIPSLSVFKKPKILLISLLVIVVAFLLALQLLKKARLPLEPIPPPPPLQTTHSTALAPNTNPLRGKFSSFPKSLSLYQIEPFIFNLQEATSLAQKLGFTQAPTLSPQTEKGQFYSWTTEESYLSVNSQVGTIDYGHYPRLLFPKISEAAPDSQRAQDAAQKFLKENRLEIPNTTLKLQKIAYLSPAGGYLKESTPDQSSLTALYYNLAVSDIKISSPNPEEKTLVFVFDTYLNLVSFNYLPPFKKLTPLSSYPLKTESQVLSELKDNFKIDFLAVQGKPYLTFTDYQTLTTITLVTVDLVYYSSVPQQNILQPVFAVKGEGTTKSGQTATTTTLVPAVSSEYLAAPQPSPLKSLFQTK